jgi:hypothetical protein
VNWAFASSAGIAAHAEALLRLARPRRAVGCVALAALGFTAACSPDVGRTRAVAGTGGGEGTGGGGGNGGILVTGGTTPSAEDVKARCNQSSLAPPVLRRLTRRELENTILDVFPQIANDFKGVKLGPDPLSQLKFTNDASVLVVGTETAKEVLRTAQDVAGLVTGASTLPAILPCAANAPDAACAATFIDTFGPRLYRRALTDEERRELVDYEASVADRSTFTMGLKWTLIAMLQSPEVLYRSEIGDASGQLDQHEIATELAYTFGGSTPSPELVAKADRGELGSPEALVAEAQALQATERGKETLRQFFREWAGYEKVLGVTRDAVPGFDVYGKAMVEETRRFIDEVVWNTGGGVKELLTANYTFVDETLAPFYSFGNAPSGFTKAMRPPNWGIGLTAQGSILAGTSHPKNTSPVFRGLLVFAKLLCNVPPKPPPIVPTIDQAAPANTTRERYQNSHAQSSCAGCHQMFEPFGYAFEHFDETGRYRETENGYPIDARATAQLIEGTQLTFDGLDDLVTQLANQPVATDCVSGLLATYAFAGGGGQVCLAEDARGALSSGAIGLRDFYARLVTAPSFTHRAR